MQCQITGKVFDVLRSLQEEEKKPKDYGTGQVLYHSELGFLDTIQKNPKAKISSLAETLGITKGAVTQTANKLQDKGMVEYYQMDGNKKEKYLKLTSLGKEAIAGHAKLHQEANDALCEYFCSLSEGQTKVILDFLNHLQECVPFCEFNCKGVRETRKGQRDELIGC